MNPANKAAASAVGMKVLESWTYEEGRAVVVDGCKLTAGGPGRRGPGSGREGHALLAKLLALQVELGADPVVVGVSGQVANIAAVGDLWPAKGGTS